MTFTGLVALGSLSWEARAGDSYAESARRQRGQEQVAKELATGTGCAVVAAAWGAAMGFAVTMPFWESEPGWFGGPDTASLRMTGIAMAIGAAPSAMVGASWCVDRVRRNGPKPVPPIWRAPLGATIGLAAGVGLVYLSTRAELKALPIVAGAFVPVFTATGATLAVEIPAPHSRRMTLVPMFGDVQGVAFAGRW